MADTIGAQLSRKRFSLCEDIAGLIAAFEAETGVTVTSAMVEFKEEKDDSGELSPMVTKRIVDVICSF